MLELQNKIVSLCEKAEIPIDKMDLGVTLTVAMTQKQRDDLSAMMDYLEQMKSAELAFNVLHDLRGLKAVYLGDPAGDCFVPRSSGYAARA